jgi:hypothetical protein
MQVDDCNFISRLAREDAEFHAALTRGIPPRTVLVFNSGVELD